MTTTAEKIKIMQAFVDGEYIEYRCAGSSSWHPLDSSEPVWDWMHIFYRVKQEPMEIWVNIYPSGEKSVHSTKKQAELYKSSAATTKKFREVIEDAN